MLLGMGDEKGDSYTPHSPKNLFPTEAKKMSFDQREVPIIGHWPSTSRMPERVDRSVCASELLLRNAIVQRIAEVWGIAPAYHLPATPHGHIRIGKPNEPGAQALPDLEHGTPEGTTNVPTPSGSQNDDTHPAIGTTELLLAGVTSPNDDTQETECEITTLTQTQSVNNYLLSPNIEN